jgi:hypothetical protein
MQRSLPYTATTAAERTAHRFDHCGANYEVLRWWRRHDSLPDTIPPWPAVKVNGYTAELVPDTPDSTPQTGYVEVDGGIGRLGAVLTHDSPGWSVYYSATGCTYSFATVFDAMAHAVEYLV